MKTFLLSAISSVKKAFFVCLILVKMALLGLLLQIYLVLTALFEFHSIANTVREGATRSSPVLRELVGGGRNAEERKGIDALW